MKLSLSSDHANNGAKTKRSGMFGSMLRLSKSSAYKSSLTERTSDISAEGQVVVPLLPIEEGNYSTNLPAISTLTWFQGDHKEAAQFLRCKANAIVQANPWLTGRVLKRKGKLVLVHPETIEGTESQNDEYNDVPFNLEHISDPKDSPLHHGVLIKESGGLCSPFLVKNDPKSLLWKVTIVPCRVSPDRFFAVVHSFSHIVSDGHTYYKIHNMMFANDEILPLKVDRIFDTIRLQREALGRKEHEFLNSSRLTTGILRGVLKTVMLAPVGLAPKIKERYFLVDNDKLGEEKKAAMQDNSNESIVDGVKFVSTNDVLTSWFFRHCRSSFGLMVLNFRNRLEGHGDELAGNYQNYIMYYPDDYESPRLIRKSLIADPKTWKRQVTHEEKTPSAWVCAKKQWSLITNWTTFSKNSNLPNCKEELHYPLSDADNNAPLPNNLSLGIIFRAGPGKTAVFVTGNAKVMRGLENASFESKETLQ